MNCFITLVKILILIPFLLILIPSMVIGFIYSAMYVGFRQGTDLSRWALNP